MGQDNVKKNDAKFKKRPFHFGIHMGFNTSDFKVRLSDQFTYSDSILSVNAKGGPGFNLNILGALHLNKNFELRVVPGVAFMEKRFSLVSLEQMLWWTRKLNLST